MNLLEQPSWEYASGWSYTETGNLGGGAQRFLATDDSGGFAYHGLYVLRLRSWKGTLFGQPKTVGGYAEQSVTLVNGTTYEPRVYYRLYSSDAGSTKPLECWVDDGSGIWAEIDSVALEDASSIYKKEVFSTFVAAGTSGGIRFQVDPATANSNAIWHLDQARLGEPETVAVQLGERAVGAIVTQLQSSLATELTAIDTDRGDGVTMAAPVNAAYYQFERETVSQLHASTGAAVVEVFDGDFDFDNPYIDADSQRASYEIPITIRVTWFNADNDTMTVMKQRAWRYQSGVFNVLNKNPLLGGSDAAIKIAVVEGVRTALDRSEDDPSVVTKGRVTIPTRVSCEEVQS